MKNMKRLASLVLALLMAATSVATLASCNGDKPKGGEESTVAQGSENVTVESANDEVSGDVHPEIRQKNWGEDFYLHILPDVNPTGCYWVEESKNDLMSEAVFERQQKIYNYLGVEIFGRGTGNFSQYIEPFTTAVKNKDGSVDLLISHVHTGVGGLVSENYLTDYNNIPGVMIEEDYWNQEFMENISINDHKYLGFNDFNILYTYVVTYNKDMLDKYKDALDETVYSMVDNHRWTLDKMISLANLAYIDTTNDGKTSDDQFGITGHHWVPFCGFIHSSNINLVKMDNQGNYIVSVYDDVNREKTANLIATIEALAESNASWFWHNDTWDKVNLYGGKTLMNLSATIHLSGFVDYDVPFGVLPYPMYDEGQASVGYRSLQWGGYLCVPSYTRDLQMIGETVEMLAFFSEPVRVTYFEKLLGKQVADSPDDSRMLDIVWDSICSDFGQTYYDEVNRTQLLYMVPVLTKTNATESISSFMAAVDKMANKQYKKFVSDCE